MRTIQPAMEGGVADNHEKIILSFKVVIASSEAYIALAL